MGDTITLSMIIDQIGVFLAIPILVFFAWNLWMHYINTLYFRSIDWVILEIVPPKEVFKSPEAMELVLNSIFGGGYGNWYERYWKGELAQYYSLEIASIEGKIHYYVRFAKKFKKVFEAMLYAQYPQAEIRQVEDYTESVPDFKPNNGWNIFAYNVVLNKDEVYPIKTYIDFGMDKNVGIDENQKIDPMSPMLEIMGSIGAGEQIWFQIIARADIKRFSVTAKDGGVLPNQSWKKKADEVAGELRRKVNPPDKDGKITFTPATKGQLNVIEAIERHKNKNAFECGMRVIYVAKKENFSGNSITAFTSMLRQFSSDDMNSFGLRNLTKSDFPWDNILDIRVNRLKEKFLKDYKYRHFFYGKFDFWAPKHYFGVPSNFGENPFIMTTEELATLFHLPGNVIETPTFSRLDSVKAEPPSNLPM